MWRAWSIPIRIDGRAILPHEGKTFAPVFGGREPEGHEALYWEHIGNRAMRQGQWKMAWDRRTQVWELYDLDSDPTELNNLVDELPERLRSMQSDLGSVGQASGCGRLPPLTRSIKKLK